MMERKNKIVFVTFANTAFARTLERMRRQLLSSSETKQLFAKFYFFTEKDLDQNFRRQLKPWLYRRGYGYWRWKPYLVQKVLATLADGDVLVYSDAGCDYNAKAIGRLREYIDRVMASKSGILVFQDNQMEYQRSKGDVLDFLGVREKRNILCSNQFFSGCFILVKSKNSVDFVSKWNKICVLHPDLVTDKASCSPNPDGFLEHRHDQSVFSLLAKEFGALALPPEEFAKSNFANIPFMPSRHKEKSRREQIRRYLLLPWRWLAGMYLKHVKHFYFSGRVAW